MKEFPFKKLIAYNLKVLLLIRLNREKNVRKEFKSENMLKSKTKKCQNGALSKC